MKNFVDCHWLNDHLNDKNLFVLDCRFDLFDSFHGKKSYSKSHIANAYYLDINSDFSGRPMKHGGARPKPNAKTFSQKLETIGINMSSTVICYDDRTYSSARAWWQLKNIGLKNVYILNGGYREWLNNKFPISHLETPPKSQGHVIPTIDNSIYCDVDTVKNAIETDKAVLVDSREHRRFTGDYEPLYAKKGHIPHAINIHFEDNLDSVGMLKDITSLKANFNFLEKDKEVITYCGSAIDGAVNFAILDELGYKAKLYIGSVSDWISYEENELIKE